MANRTSSVSKPCRLPPPPSAELGLSGLCSSPAASIFLPISLATSRTIRMAGAADRLTVLAFAAFVVIAIVGLAFAVGYLIGRIFL